MSNVQYGRSQVCVTRATQTTGPVFRHTILWAGVLLCILSIRVAPAAPTLAIDDPAGVLGKTEAPVVCSVKLSKRQLAAARENRLAVLEKGGKPSAERNIPVQLEPGVPKSDQCRLVFLLAPGATGRHEFELRVTKIAPSMLLQGTISKTDGQIDLSELRLPADNTPSGRPQTSDLSLRTSVPILRYNYRTIEPGSVLDQVSAANRIYARARSDYIHPLFGLQGEVLTRDWSVDHPHHRGIYWAWPEVDFGKERGDLHALQRVFARPTGKVKLQSGAVFAEVEAENEWVWEDREPIVREVATIRAYRSAAQGRVIDLAFRFVALRDGISIARRGTEHYGGLNVRLETPREQQIAVHTDLSNAVPRRAWSDLSGAFSPASAVSGLMIFQHRANPDYPGDWIQYPELSWCQPTFPAAGRRYALEPGRPLVLRFRLWVHRGAKPNDDWAAESWDAFNDGQCPGLNQGAPSLESPPI